MKLSGYIYVLLRENPSKKFKSTYFWRVLGFWNHCALRPSMQSTNSLRKSVTIAIDWSWKFWNVHIVHWCDLLCRIDFCILFSWKTFLLSVHMYVLNTRLILFSVPILILTFKRLRKSPTFFFLSNYIGKFWMNEWMNEEVYSKSHFQMFFLCRRFMLHNLCE